MTTTETASVRTAELAVHLVDGQFAAATGSRQLRREDPSGSGTVTTLVPATAEEVTGAVDAAWAARTAWRRTAPAACRACGG